jgi:DNA invertase Pin-like site-specific DNA recombinase
MTKPHAYSYLRVSGKGQVDGDGFPRQRAAIGRYAKAQGIEIVEEYRDAAVSGERELADRKGLAAVLAAVQTGEVRTVLIERADRLARDLIVGEIILSQFRAAGVAVWSAEGGVDLTAADDDPTKRLIRQILGAVAEYDKTVTVLKLRAARERMRRQTGRCEGVKPYGYRPGEPEVIARMRQLRRKPQGEPRLGYHRIAKILNAEGRPTRTGSPWTSSTVRKVLLRA